MNGCAREGDMSVAAFARWRRYPAPVEWQAPERQVDFVYIQYEYAIQLVGK